MEGEYEQPPDLCRFALPDAALAFLLLTSISIKAALFTAIVTAFVLDAMSDIDENTETKLLRLLVEQSVTNAATRAPPSDPPSSILTVSSLWFLSIMSSLAATTWAILCLEWCAFLTDRVQADDYEEMAGERQRKFEAVNYWRMHFVVAAIPFFLHLSLFLFLGGLWLRLREVNKQLGLIVGVSSLIIALSYVVVALLPIFTDAPYSTSASELIQPVADGIRRIVEFGLSIRPPRVFSWILKLLPVRITSWFSIHFRLPKARGLPTFLKRTYLAAKMLIGVTWNAITLLPFIPTFGSRQNPFNELNGLKCRHRDQDGEIYQRALFRLLGTPLRSEEVKEILKELEKSGYKDEKPLDRSIVRLLVLSLSSILADDRVSNEERPIFDHCALLLTKEMGRAFRVGEYRKIEATVVEKLSPHFDLTSSPDYWKKAGQALWFCPSQETVRTVVKRLDLDMRSTEEPPDLENIVRALHAATLTYSNPEFDLESIPDFSLWSWNFGPPKQGLAEALSRYLQSLFAAYYKNPEGRGDYTTEIHGDPTTVTSLIVDRLNALDGDPKPDTLKLHNALCFFVVVTQRSYPKVFEEELSVAHALLESAVTWGGNGGSGPMDAEVLATRLFAIAYGPRPLIMGKNYPISRLRTLYVGLPDSINTNQNCLYGFLEADAATLEAVLAAGSLGSYAWNSYFERTTDIDPCRIRDMTSDSVRQHPNRRLPYLYSLAITLSYTEKEQRPLGLEVADLFVTHDERNGIEIGRALDTNILVVAVLRLAPLGDVAQVKKWKDSFRSSLGKIVIDGTNWQTQWKSIYLIADLAVLLHKTHTGSEREGQMAALTDAARKSFQDILSSKPDTDPEREGQMVAPTDAASKPQDTRLGCAPSDWERKREGLRLCKLEAEVGGLSRTAEAIYEWSDREHIPYLSLYNPPYASSFGGALAVFQQ